MQLFRRVSFVALSLLSPAVATSSQAGSHPFPWDVIRIVVAGASSPVGIISRIVANELHQDEGWRIVIESKPGAMHTIAGAEVLKQPADGHTILALGLPAMTAPVLLRNVNFRLETDFLPVVRLSTSYNVLVAGPSVPATSLGELVALLKREPDKLNFSSGGFGTPAHLIGELFKQQTDVRAVHVPYRSQAHSVSDLLNGTNHYQFITPMPVLDLIAAGKLRALAVTAPERMPVLKDVPTVVEAGFPELVVEDWNGYLVKHGTPDNIVVRLNQAINKALAKPEVRAAFAKLGSEPAGGSPAEFGKFINSQLVYWGKVVKDSSIKMQQ